jgi:hypothetical protein
MKQSRKQQLKAKKHAAIYTDFEKMFCKNTPLERIFTTLENKYFLDKGTIYRIVLSKKAFIKDGGPVKAEP